MNVEIDDDWQAHVSEIRPHDEVTHQEVQEGNENPWEGVLPLSAADQNKLSAALSNISPDWDNPKLQRQLRKEAKVAQDNTDRWQAELDQFISCLTQLQPVRSASREKLYFNVVVHSDDSWDGIIMPVGVDAHPWLRSKAMRAVMLEMFKQGFSYGASWEQTRAEGEDDE